MHKYIKQCEVNRAAKFEQFCLLDGTKQKAKVKKAVTRSKEIDCLSLLSNFYYKTDD